ncbi:MAG: hypothetical protein GEV08_17480 [Acidimicrobiia bacterium]|nr:hypothetical protein [Acidimicrobiia bacterium]
MSASAWGQALDAFERGVLDGEAVLAGGRTEAVAPFEEPVGLDGLPAELAPRAQALLARARELEAGLARRLADRPPTVVAPRFGRAAPAERSHRLDTGL